MISAQFSVVRICLEALQRVCYDVPDFSHFKALALNAGDTPSRKQANGLRATTMRM